MAELISVPLKKSSDVEIVKPLKNLIQATYNNDEDFTEALNELSRLRAAAVWKVFDKTSLDAIYDYYDQLVSLESKVPPQEVQIPFKWKDAFDRGSLFGGRMSLTVSSLTFERVCIEFNIAALSSAVGVQAAAAPDTDEALKTSAKLLQQAAGIFLQLKGKVMPAVQGTPTPDLQPDTLHALHAIMLAQAQEVIVYKCARDEMSPNALSKVCAGCAELYADAARALSAPALRALDVKEWSELATQRQQAMTGLAQYHMSLADAAKGAVGVQIARLKAAVQSLSAGGAPPALTDILPKAQRALAAANKDNDFIYHERIPDLSSLEAVPRAIVAKPTPPQTKYGTRPDLFASLLPLSAAREVSAAEAARASLVHAEIDKLRHAGQMLTGILASLNLPGCLERGSPSGAGGTPEVLSSRAAALRGAGGVAGLDALTRELPELLQRNRDILDEAERMLREEAEADEGLRRQWGARWTRTPSSQLTETFHANANKYRQIIDNAVRADSIVSDKLRQHREALLMLESSEHSLGAALPAPAAANAAERPALQTLTQLMQQVERLKREREELEKQLKESPAALKSALLSRLRDNAGVDASAAEQLAPLAPLSQRLAESLAQQEALLAEIQEAHTSLMSARGSPGGNTGGSSREEVVGRLCAAHDAFQELSGNLKEGIKFYNDLTQLLVAFQNKVSDYCFARRTEKEELMKDLTQDAARSPQQNAAEEPVVVRREPPPRPAPPAPSALPAPPAVQPGHSATLPYPAQPQGMPVPYGNSTAPYPYYVAPMPATYNPYATLPYPHHYPPAAPGQPPAYPAYSPYAPQHPQYPPQQ